jgi:hypothetical protein
MMFAQNVVFAFKTDAENQDRESIEDLSVATQNQATVPLEINTSPTTDLVNTNREPTDTNNENKEVQPDGGETNNKIEAIPSIPTIR